jgi:dihydrofolate synthase/folylpolyglutamate synthase
VERLRPEIDRYNRISPYGPLSFFEVYTALAFQYFKEEEVDFAVLETGLGGRLDATNVVWPHVCGITSISLDHTQKLGDTPAAIAAEKAGIIKSRQSAGIPSSRLAVVSAPQETEVMRVLRDRCRQEGADFYEVGKDICCREGAVTGDSQRFTISGIAGEFRDVAIRLLGSYQPVNAALAVSLVVLLAQRNGLRIEERGVREGLYRTVWPGRFEIVSRDPVIVLDGAHNPASAGELRRNLEAYFPGKRIILILGISLDKDIRGICAELIPYSNEVILSRANNPRAASPAHIADCARGCGGGARTMHVTADISRALELARKNNTADSVIVTAGSLFLVAEARERLMKELRTGAR